MHATIVAECGLNHFGKLDLAKRLADDALISGANIAKFQTYIPEKILRKLDKDYALLASLALSQADFKELAKHCEHIGIEFMSTPGDTESLKFLVNELGVQRIKIGSDDLTNERLLTVAASTLLPIILSTGMSTLPEVYSAVRATNFTNVTLLHCVSLYPTPIKYANVAAITSLREYFKDWDIPVGYSDHTRSFNVIGTAAALGAMMIEAHFRLGDGSPPVDDAVSFTPDNFAAMVRRVRNTELILGNGVKEPGPVERAMIPLLRKGEDGLRGLNGIQMELSL
jgi:sialic acid synthase SpsE